MISFFFQENIAFGPEEVYRGWISAFESQFECCFEDLQFVFCTDAYLHNINLEFLGHDTFTDIITFENTGQYEKYFAVKGEIYISTDRVMENSKTLELPFEHELRRVMAHGMLHLIGYKDKTQDDILMMRRAEDKAMELFHVEH